MQETKPHSDESYNLFLICAERELQCFSVNWLWINASTNKNIIKDPHIYNLLWPSVFTNIVMTLSTNLQGINVVLQHLDASLPKWQKFKSPLRDYLFIYLFIYLSTYLFISDTEKG